MEQNELAEKIQVLQNILIEKATDDTGDEQEYISLREEFIADQTIKPLLPDFVRTCRNLVQFRNYIKKFPSWRERREHVWEGFNPLLEWLESSTNIPTDKSVSDLLETLNAQSVMQIWDRALQRRINEPEGAITSARTLLESVCKHVLEDLSVSYDDKLELPKLYKLTADNLNLAPDQHAEQIFKQILGGCQSVVEGLGAVRNKFGDAHGKGRNHLKAAPRHAELAVNLAGAMAIFLIRTWEFRKDSQEQ